MTGRHAERQADLITLPIILISLLRFSDVSVQLNRARDGSSTWYFRFSPRVVLQVGDDGGWSWRKAPERWRRQISPFIARAEAMLQKSGVAVALQAADALPPAPGAALPGPAAPAEAGDRPGIL